MCLLPQIRMEDTKRNPDDSAYGSTDTSQKSLSSSKSHQSSRSSSSGYDQPSTSGSSCDVSAEIKHKEIKSKKGKDCNSTSTNYITANSITNSSINSKTICRDNNNINSSKNDLTSINNNNSNNNNNNCNSNSIINITKNSNTLKSQATDTSTLNSNQSSNHSEMKQKIMAQNKTHDVSKLTNGVNPLMVNGFHTKTKKLQQLYAGDIHTLSALEGDPLLNFPFDNLKKSSTMKTKDCFVVAVSLQEGIVLYISTSISDTLGYPKDMWLGRRFIDFVYPKDQIVFTTHITMELNLPLMEFGGHTLNGDCHQSSFYCRFRVYRGLKNNGFGLTEKKPSYKPFHVYTKLAEVGKESHPQEIPNVNNAKSPYVLAYALPVVSAYRVPDEIPTMKTFTTRHSASCHFNHMDTSAIPFLGYLPQDILGNSIFDYYHPEDLHHLREVYQQILKEDGRLFRSKPYRFKLRSGYYALLCSEWSCFINPWTRKLEFIIGQHKVLRGPKDPDIFSDLHIDAPPISEDVYKESKNIQMEIKHALRETVKRTFNDGNKDSRKRRKELAKYVGNLIEEMVQTIEMDTYDKAYKEGESFSEQGSAVMGHISPHHQGSASEPSSETAPSYDHCNYNDNIQRYFDSQPKTHSTDGSAESNKITTPPIIEEEKCSPPADSGSGDDTGGESANLQVNFGSEGSPVQENPSISGEALGHPYVRVTLTEEILLRHNAITEKFFIQQKRETKTMGHHSLTAADAAETFMTGLGINKHYTPVAPGPGITLSTNAAYSRKDSQRLKRCGSHSPDLEKHKLNKHSHAEPSSTVSFNNPIANPAVGLWPPFSMPLSSGEATNCSTAQPHSFLSMNSSNLSLPTPIHSINNKNPSLGNVTFPNYAYFPNGPLNTSLSIEGPQMATHFLMPVQYISAVPGSLMYPVSPVFHPTSLTPVVIPNIGLYPTTSASLRTQNSLDSSRAQPNTTTSKNHNIATLLSHRQKTTTPQHGQTVDFSSIKFQPSKLNTSVKVSTSLSTTSFQREVHTQGNSGETPEHQRQSNLFPNCDSNKIVHSTTERSPVQTDSDGADPDLQDDLTGSSLNSFLKSDDISEDSLKTDSSNQSVTVQPEKATEKAKPLLHVNQKPSWLNGIELTPDIVYRYQMIKRDLSDILKSDMDFLSKTKQPDLANEQLAQLYEELTQQNGCQSNINPIDIDIGFRELSSDDALSEFLDDDDGQLCLLTEDNLH